jgi:RNA polymerase-binding transcription factor DksA
MTDNHTIHVVDIPTAGKEGLVWNRLHEEREDVCEALLKDLEPASRAEHHRGSLHARLRKIDDALDRLMAGAYGRCSKCGRPIEAAVLRGDPAWAVCVDCWSHDPRATCSGNENRNTDTGPVADLLLQSLSPFDTILLQTQNSEYRILLLDPETGRSLVEGGSFLSEPRETLVMGSGIPGREFKGGAICVGRRVEMWAAGKILLTSPIKSVEVKHNAPADQ